MIISKNLKSSSWILPNRDRIQYSGPPSTWNQNQQVENISSLLIFEIYQVVECERLCAHVG